EPCMPGSDSCLRGAEGTRGAAAASWIRLDLVRRRLLDKIRRWEPKMPDASGLNGRVVLIAYYYPPLVGPASARAASFGRHLDQRTVKRRCRGNEHRSAGSGARGGSIS